jgi:type II secretory pathway pseudopilin PulG
MVKQQKEIQSMSQNLFGNEKGFSLIDILVAIAIVSVALVSLLGLASFSLATSTLIRQANQANNIAQETIEIVRNFRDGTTWDVDGLGKLATSTDYHPEKTGSPPKWQLIQGEETIGIFKRKVVFKDVFRDSDSNIVESGGNFDPNTKKVIVDVSWQEKGRTHLVEITTYLTNWKQ